MTPNIIRTGMTSRESGANSSLDNSPDFQGIFTGHNPARRLGQEVFKNSRIESGRVRWCSKFHVIENIASLSGFRFSVSLRSCVFSVFLFSSFPGVCSHISALPGLSWVGSGRVGSGRVGSGRVGSGRVGTGRVGSGRVGLGPDPSQGCGRGVTAGPHSAIAQRVTRASNPPVARWDPPVARVTLLLL